MLNKHNSLLGRINKEVRESVNSALDYAKRSGYSLVDYTFVVDQLVRGEQTDFSLILDYFNIDRSKLAKDIALCLERTKPPRGKPMMDEDFLNVLEGSWIIATLSHNDSKIRSGYVLHYSLQDSYVRGIMKRISEQFAKINVTELEEKFHNIVENSIENNLSQGDGIASHDHENRQPAGSGSQALVEMLKFAR